MDIPFVKMHGLGNDYVYIDAFETAVPADLAGLARRMSDRHRGVGGDGVILVEPSRLAVARMRIFNADGSEAEMCGNGVRCVAHLVVSRGRTAPGLVTIETGRGVLEVDVRPVSRRLSQVRVDMGPPLLSARDIPVDLDGDSDRSLIDVECPVRTANEPWVSDAGWDHRMTCVSMGNPHAVLFCRDVAAVPLAAFGPRLENHAMFPNRTNVHVVQVLTMGHVRVRTWERGSGVTQACGTGAAAVCVAGRLTGRTGGAITAELPGGELLLEWDGRGAVFMTGPAESVFEGTWPEPPGEGVRTG